MYLCKVWTDIKESLDIATKEQTLAYDNVHLIWIGMDFKSMKPYNDKVSKHCFAYRVLCYLLTGMSYLWNKDVT
jgi:hypothetical protein